MAGFMSGFGTAFANSFNQHNAESAAVKRDKIKMDYDDFRTRRDAAEKQDKINEKNIKAAKQMVAMTGQPDEAWSAVYDMLSADVSQSEIMKQLQANTAIVNPEAATTQPGEGATASDPRDDLTQGAATAVDAQMEQSGMTPPPPGEGLFGDAKTGMGVDSAQQAAPRPQQTVPPQTAEQVPPPKPVSGENIPGRSDAKITWQPKAEVPDISKVNSIGDAIAYQFRIEQTGTPEQKLAAKDLLERYQHMKATEAKLEAQANGTGFQFARGWMRDAEGGWTGGVVTPRDTGRGDGSVTWEDAYGNPVDASQILPANKNMESDIEAISKEMSKPLDDYEKAKSDYKTMARSSAKLTKLTQMHPEALGKSGDLSQWSDELKRAGVNILQIVNPALDLNGNVIPRTSNFSQLDKAETALKGTLKGLTDRNAINAVNAGLIDIEATRLAYLYAAQSGQEGRSVAITEFENFKNVATGRGNPDTLAQSAANFLEERRKNLAEQEQMINRGGGAGINFKGKYPGVPNPFEIRSTLEQEIQDDPELQTSLDTVDAAGKPAPGGQVDTEQKDVPKWLSKAVAQDGGPITPEVWRELSPAGRKYLEKKFGDQE
jgi:hypothetical protein